MPKYMGALILVKDITAARAFYEDCLGQKVEFDFGEDVQFAGGLSIHQQDHFQALLGTPERYPVTLKANNGELFFEAAEIEVMQERLKQAGVTFIHEIREEPWGQRTLRVYDPDGHIIEICESMDAALRRLNQQGLSAQDAARRTGMPLEYVEKAIQE